MWDPIGNLANQAANKPRAKFNKAMVRSGQIF